MRASETRREEAERHIAMAEKEAKPDEKKSAAKAGEQEKPQDLLEEDDEFEVSVVFQKISMCLAASVAP